MDTPTAQSTDMEAAVEAYFAACEMDGILSELGIGMTEYDRRLGAIMTRVAKERGIDPHHLHDEVNGSIKVDGN